MDVNLKVGDWVRSYSSGIYRVLRVIHFQEYNPATKGYDHITLVHSARFVNNSFKRSFSSEICSADFVYKLNKEDNKELEKYISSKSDVLIKFENYKPKKLSCSHVVNIHPVNKNDTDEIYLRLSRMVDIDKHEIFIVLFEEGIRKNDGKGWSAVFVSDNYKVINNKLVYAFDKICEI